MKNKLNIKKILPKNWKSEDLGKKIKIGYNNPNKSPTPLIINKKIIICEELGILMGFWAGDGSKNYFGLSNNNLKVLKTTYKIILKYIGNIELKLRINIPINFIDKKDSIITKIKKEFPKLRIGSIAIYKEKRNSPNIYLYNNKIVVSKFIKLLFEYLSKNIEFNNLYWDGYLKGFFAAEGNVYVRKDYNTLSKVNISQNDNLYKELAINSLKVRNINYNKYKKGVTISGKKNFDILFLRGICDLHPLKKEQFLIGYKNHKQEQYENGITNLLILKELKIPKTISSVAKNINRCRQTIREHVLLKPKSLLDLDLIKICKNGSGSKGNVWTITNRGLEYLNEFKNE